MMDFGTNKAGSPIGGAKTGLLIVAAAGWALFAYAALSAGPDEDTAQATIEQLSEQLEAVTAERDQLAQEREQSLQVSQNLQDIKDQLDQAQRELQDLDASRTGVSRAIEKAQALATGSTKQPQTTSSLR
jgi:septal ring factor EnvC (AmiA/AmiB activator)